MKDVAGHRGRNATERTNCLLGQYSAHAAPEENLGGTIRSYSPSLSFTNGSSFHRLPSGWRLGR
jgi:hypothetical protein